MNNIGLLLTCISLNCKVFKIQKKNYQVSLKIFNTL